MVVIDWGLVKQNTDGGQADVVTEPGLTSSGSTIGTYDYMAPEQATDAGGVDIRADLYSLGATLYCLLAGHPPFHGRTNQQKLKAQLSEPFPPLNRLRKDIPGGLIKVLDRMVEKEATKRYLIPAEVVNALQGFCCRPDSPTLLDLLESPAVNPAPGLKGNPIFDGSTDSGSVTPPGGPSPISPTPPYPGHKPTSVPIGGRVAAVAAYFQRALGGALPGNGLGGRRAAMAGLIGVVLLGVFLFVLSAVRSRSPVLLDEDFRESLKNNRALPEGWTGNALTVVADENKRACLETAKKEGDDLVTLPTLALGDNFSIEGDYILRGYQFNSRTASQSLSIQLESTKGDTTVRIVINHAGFVTIGNNQPRQAPGFPLPPPQDQHGNVNREYLGQFKISKFRMIRDGKMLRVYLNGKPAATATLEDLPDTDTVRIGLTAGVVEAPFPRIQKVGYAARLYNLKICSPATNEPSKARTSSTSDGNSGTP